MADERPTCFVVMPITTPSWSVERYGGDKDHFKHVLSEINTPALEEAGFEVIPPATTGSQVIQASIIEHLTSADLVLCDMSTLNANVFFEVGIRTALNRPVCMVVDDSGDRVPFDTGIIHHHEYRSDLNSWIVKEEVESLADHIRDTAFGPGVGNEMWRHFGTEATLPEPGELPTDASVEDKLDLMLARLDALQPSMRLADVALRLDRSRQHGTPSYMGRPVYTTNQIWSSLPESAKSSPENIAYLRGLMLLALEETATPPELLQEMLVRAMAYQGDPPPLEVGGELGERTWNAVRLFQEESATHCGGTRCVSRFDVRPSQTSSQTTPLQTRWDADDASGS